MVLMTNGELYVIGFVEEGACKITRIGQLGRGHDVINFGVVAKSRLHQCPGEHQCWRLSVRSSAFPYPKGRVEFQVSGQKDALRTGP